MKKFAIATGLIFSCAALVGCSSDPTAPDSTETSTASSEASQITFTTDQGAITIETDPAAPETVGEVTQVDV